MTAPLIVTADQPLLDELSRLAAAAGVTPEVAADEAAALRSWAGASQVLLGADLAPGVAATRPPRRDGVHIVSWGRVPDQVFRSAVEVGAEDVAELPQSGSWVVELLTDLGDGARARGLTIGVVGGSGGAGATTFACALGQVAARGGPAIVVDTDPLGPGIDRILGLDRRDGVRWDALCQTSGRISARSLRDAVPRAGSLGVLTWYAGTRGRLQPFAVREAMSAAQRGHDTVLVDLPRSVDPLVEEVVARCDVVLVVTSASVPGLASAARLCARFDDPGRVRLVLRGTGVRSADVARVVGAPVLCEMGDQRRLDEALDLGLGPVRSPRGALGRAASDVLDRLTQDRLAA